MKIDGTPYRSVWVDADGRTVRIIDQTKLPWALSFPRLVTLEHALHAITTMQVRGAPLIGAVAAYGVCLALVADVSDQALHAAASSLIASRPTAVNLGWAVRRMVAVLTRVAPEARVEAAYAEAARIAEEDVRQCRAIGENGVALIEALARAHGRTVNILTHCNAGWLATVDWGTALAPVYVAQARGVAVHVFVDETRPRNQGAALTAWELGRHGVAHTVIADNAGGHLMQHGEVDLVIVGADRVTRSGDVANKIGTYLKALAAHDTGVPFWVAVPSSTIDWTLRDGLAAIPIEERSASEVTTISGRAMDGHVTTVRLVPRESQARNPAFDVTPARLVTGFITESGCCAASEAGLVGLFPQAA